MKYLIINDHKYELIKDYKNAFSMEAVSSKITDYFYMYNYIVGDYSYGSLRLKGFCNRDNENFRDSNDYSKLDQYIKNYCAYDCKYFILVNLDIMPQIDMEDNEV